MKNVKENLTECETESLVKKYGCHSTIFDVVKDYLSTHKVTFGTTIDTIEILENLGMPIPNKKEDEFEYMSHIKLAGSIGSELVKQLNAFGFTSDKRKDHRHHQVKKHYEGNVVYTRFPWTAFQKAYKGGFLSLAMMKANHTDWVDFTDLKEIHKGVYETGMAVANKKADIADMLELSIAQDLTPLYNKFHQSLERSMSELVPKFHTLQPVRYGQY